MWTGFDVKSNFLLLSPRWWIRTRIRFSMKMTIGMRLRVPGFLCSRPHPQAIVFPLVPSLGGGGSQLGRLKRKPGTLCIVWFIKYFHWTKNKRFYACFFLFFHIWKHSTVKNMTILLLTNVSRGRTRRLWMMFSFTSINMGFFMIRVFYSNLEKTKFCTHFFLLFTFWSYFYIIFHGKKVKKVTYQ